MPKFTNSLKPFSMNPDSLKGFNIIPTYSSDKLEELYREHLFNAFFSRLEQLEFFGEPGKDSKRLIKRKDITKDLITSDVFLQEGSSSVKVALNFDDLVESLFEKNLKKMYKTSDPEERKESMLDDELDSLFRDNFLAYGEFIDHENGMTEAEKVYNELKDHETATKNFFIEIRDGLSPDAQRRMFFKATKDFPELEVYKDIKIEGKFGQDLMISAISSYFVLEEDGSALSQFISDQSMKFRIEQWAEKDVEFDNHIAGKLLGIKEYMDEDALSIFSRDCLIKERNGFEKDVLGPSIQMMREVFIFEKGALYQAGKAQRSQNASCEWSFDEEGFFVANQTLQLTLALDEYVGPGKNPA